MRIAFLGPAFPWRGGISGFAQKMGEKLFGQGHSIMMFSFKHQYPAWLFPGSNQVDPLSTASPIPAVRVLTPYNPLTWFKTMREISKWKPDIVIVSFWIPFMAPAYGFVLRRVKNAKRVFLLHNIDFHERWLFASQLTHYALAAADAYISLSEVTNQALRKIMGQATDFKVIQLFHPVYEQPEVQEAVVAGKFKILFFGFVKHYKGLDILLEAFSKASANITKLRLIIAGDVYGDKQFYLDQIKRLGIGSKVETHFEYISDNQIGHYFNDCDLCVIPYRSATQSGVVQMSFAFNVPVIATRVGGLEEVVTHGVNGLLVPPEDSLALAEAICSYYQSGREAQFRAAIRELNKQQSWDSFVSKFMEEII